jgi:hypothetical protein
MAKNTGYARNIFFSLIISVIILLGIGFLSVNYLVPLYDLQSQDIYKFMVYLLPIFIGITFIEIGSMISSKAKDKKTDPYDLLPRNSYDDPLYSSLDDDPLKTDFMKKSDTDFVPLNQSRVSINQPIVEKQFETIANPVNTTVVNTVSTLPKQIQERLLSLSSEDAERTLNYLANDSSYYESSLETTTAEKLLTLCEEDANKLLYWLEQDAVLVDAADVVDNNITNQKPVDEDSVVLPFDKTTNDAILQFTPEQAQDAVEYILNGSKTGFIPVEYTGEFDGSVTAVLKTEIMNAKDFGYEVSLVLMNIDNTENQNNIDMFIENINNSCFNFTQDNGSIYLVFPLYNESEAKEALDKAFNNINHKMKYGITTVNERYDIDVPTLMTEALASYNN